MCSLITYVHHSQEMMSCWRYKAEERPAFWQIREVLLTIYQSVVAD